jgi:autotransporter-associated beta strand protein
MTGGSLSVASTQYGLYVGYSGGGSFTQSGGTNSSAALSLGYSSGSGGSYKLSNSGQLAATNIWLGCSGTGTFTQSGGTNSTTNLTLGLNSGSSGTYNLGGGMLAVADLATGSGTAALNLSGGTLSAAGSMSTSVPIVLNTRGGNGTIDTGGYSVALSGALSGPGGLIKAGSGTLTLTGSDKYSGGTSVVGGVLAAENASAIPSGSLLSIGAGGSVVLGTPGAAEPLGTLSGGAGPLDSQPSASRVALATPALGGGANAVPEPGTMALLAAAAACGLAVRRRGR